MPSRLSLTPPHTLSGFQGHPDTLRLMVAQAQGIHGEQSLLVRSVCERIVGELTGKDYLGEILAIRNWVTEKVRYTNDPLHVELVKTPERMIQEILERGYCAADCDESAELLATLHLCVGRVCEYVVAGFGAPGHYSHVFERAQEPRSGKWIVCDNVAGTDERGMLDRVTTFYTVSLDERPVR